MVSHTSTHNGPRRPRVLAVNRDAAVTEWLTMVLSSGGYDVRTALIAARAEAICVEWHPDVVVTGTMLPDSDGIALLKKVKTLDPRVEVVVIGDPGSSQQAVEAGRAGAFYFLEQPIHQDGLLDLMRKAADRVHERADHARLRARARATGESTIAVGRSVKMQEVFELVESVAASDANILIVGENGTGKEVVANALHERSLRAGGPFLKINCAAIPKDLIESELFGYKKGAFTGAVADKIGLLELADGGSLLLDEIGEMPAYLQTKLLRILQEREFRPIGSDRVVQVDFRLISATNIGVDQALREGKLREDLYFRINTITISVPPLRERGDDVLLLANHFREQFNRRHNKSVHGFAPEAERLLMRSQWPGNVRELENAVERAVLVCRSERIEPEDLPEVLRERVVVEGFTIPPHTKLAEIERLAILQTLERTNWNKQEAAQVLGLYRPTLYSKMKKHRITDARAHRGKPPADSR